MFAIQTFKFTNQTKYIMDLLPLCSEFLSVVISFLSLSYSNA